ncbi:MAG: hypothetical protein GY816_03110 [Cytophagales bacterium]|nr:hypothetical protein [Cytophagales bacterium]
MTIQLWYHEKDGIHYGIFDIQMNGLKIEASSLEFLRDMASKKCEEEFGKEKMLRSTLRINRVKASE